MLAMHIRTPLIESRPLGLQSGKSIFLKIESVQPGGSFKIRGVGRACRAAVDRGVRLLISSSGGNAGLAVAYAGRRLDVPVLVVVPESTPEWMRSRIESEGATVIVHGTQWAQAHGHAALLTTEEAALIHPFDDPLLWEGHSTLVDELASHGERPDAIVLSVGGGGLLSGVVAGLRKNAWDDVAVIAAETEGTASLAASMRAGRRVRLEQVSGVATSLAAAQVCEQAWRCTKEHRIIPAVVTDGAATKACVDFLEDHRILVEPACGASLAVVYGNLPALYAFERVIVVVCGGSVVHAGQCLSWR